MSELIILLTILIIMVTAVTLILITTVFFYIKKSKSKQIASGTNSKDENKTIIQESPETKLFYSTCPNCNTRYTDPTISYCLIDGAVLLYSSQNKDSA